MLLANRPADQTDAAQHAWKWDGLLLFRGCLNGSEVQHFLPLRVRDTAVHQRKDADNDQNDADTAGWVH